ncbi:MAG TPA: hypothetical protein VFW40_00270 [Capsulimonadaceae bacterium]|nr:hypothetical protein [Capsulimonadaceae bacterium]
MIRKIAALVALAAILAFAVCPARADDNSRMGVETLKGLHGVHVIVEDLDSNLTKDGVTVDKIQSNVDDQLKKAGITSMDEDTAKDDPARPYLDVCVTAIKSDDGKVYAYFINIQLFQRVTLQDGESKALGVTWQVGCVGYIAPSDVTNMYNKVTDEVGEFVDDFNSENPASTSRNTTPAKKPTKLASR